MKIDKNQLSFYILFFGILGSGSYYLYSFHSKFVNSNALVSFITFLVGGIAIFLYLKQRKDKKRDAAKIILQEIRRAEDIIFSYPETKQFRFTRKIIATNSWAKNIHYFVDDLDQDELDKISDLYSTGEYLDEIISKVSSYQFTQMTKALEEHLKMQVSFLQKKQQEPDQASPASSVTGGGQVSSGQQTQIQLQIETPWSKLFDDVVGKYQTIYHSSITEKLKEIAGLR